MVTKSTHLNFNHHFKTALKRTKKEQPITYQKQNSFLL